MFTSESILSGKLPDVRVGIGSGTDRGFVEKSVRLMGSGNIAVYKDPRKLVDDLLSGAIGAAVRGDMPSSKVMHLLKDEFGVDQLERTVLLEPVGSKLFFLAPAGIDEGWTMDRKFDIAIRSVALMEKLGSGTKIGVMSGGRKEDMGRNPAVDKTIEDAEELTRRLIDAGYDAYNAQILIEDAVDEADLIIAPDGITGNLIFRTMHFVGGARALGAPVLNIDKVFVDTSRVKTDYTDSLHLAMKLAGGSK